MLSNLVLALVLAGCIQLRCADRCAFSVHVHHPHFISEYCVVLPKLLQLFASLSLGDLDNAFSFQQQACDGS